MAHKLKDMAADSITRSTTPSAEKSDGTDSADGLTYNKISGWDRFKNFFVPMAQGL